MILDPSNKVIYRKESLIPSSKNTIKLDQVSSHQESNALLKQFPDIES